MNVVVKTFSLHELKACIIVYLTRKLKTWRIVLLVLFSESTKQEEGISFGAQQKNLRSLSRLRSECSCPRGKRRQARCLDDGCTVGILPKKEKKYNNNNNNIIKQQQAHCMVSGLTALCSPLFFSRRFFSQHWKGEKEKCDVLWKQPSLFVAEEFSEESQFVAGLSIPYPFRIPFRNKFSVYLVHWHCGGCKLQHTKLSRACIPAMLAEHTQQCPQHPHVKPKTFSLYCKIHVVKKHSRACTPQW